MKTILKPRHTWTNQHREKSYEAVEILSDREDETKHFPPYPNGVVHIDTFDPFPELYKQLYAGKTCRILHIQYEIVEGPT